MIKLIVRDKEIGGEKKLVEVNAIPDIATINFDEEDEEVTYQYNNIDVNNPKLENSKHLSDIWEHLKDDAKKLTLFEFVDKIFLSKDFIFRLSQLYKQDGKLILPIALEPYVEEAIVYVVNSCINGKINGYFKVEKATDDMLRFAKRRNNESEYIDWRDDIFDMVARDFHSSNYYETVAMEKLIKAIGNKKPDSAISEVIDILFFDKDMLKYLLISNHNEVYIKMYTSLGEKNIRRRISSKFNEFIIYKNIPIEEAFIETSNYKLYIDKKGVNVVKRPQI